MLKISFTSDDIARTRIAPSMDPLWELVLGMHMLRGQPGDLLFRDWRRDTMTVLLRTAVCGQLRVLSAVTPTLGYFPDFLTPTAVMAGFDDGLEAVRATPRSVLARELRRLSVPVEAQAEVRRLSEGNAAALTGLAESMRIFHNAAILPHRRVIDAAVDADRSTRISAMADRGVEGLFSGLHPTVNWSQSELRVNGHPDQQIKLDGRGLLLVPSYFCIRHPLTLLNESLPPVLVYPVARTPQQTLGSARALAALIGRSRAKVLQAVGDGCGTGELARRAVVSPASASEHATVLRDAGLLTSHRDGNRMVHRLTRLGAALLQRG